MNLEVELGLERSELDEGQERHERGSAGMQISKTLKNDLTKAGFTDIKILPSSFLRAKDSEGNPVIMVINPNSVTAITEATQTTNSASNADHGATPGPKSTGGSHSPSRPAGAPNHSSAEAGPG
jgi:hypothetical protein